MKIRRCRFCKKPAAAFLVEMPAGTRALSGLNQPPTHFFWVLEPVMHLLRILKHRDIEETEDPGENRALNSFPLCFSVPSGPLCLKEGELHDSL